jgi:hypothetical protein
LKLIRKKNRLYKTLFKKPRFYTWITL